MQKNNPYIKGNARAHAMASASKQTINILPPLALFLALLLAFSPQKAAAAKIFATYEVAAEQSAQLAFSAVGRIEKITAKLGAAVQKGEVLATLDASLERAQLAAAQAQSRLAASKLSRAKAASGALAKSVLDEAAAGAEFAAAQVALARAALAQKALKAPFDGQIAAVYAEEGDGVAGPAQRILWLLSAAQKLQLSFDSREDVRLGDEFEFSAPAGLLRAKITAISPAADARAHKRSAEARLLQAAPLLTGTFGEGQIITER